MTAAASLKFTVDGELSTALDIGSASYNPLYNIFYSLTDGTGANQIKQIFADTRSIPASSSEDLDLAGGLTNALGVAITFTAIKAIIVKAAAANVNDVVVGGDATAGIDSIFGAVNDTIKVKPGGMFAIVAPNATGYAVTATTADLLQIGNSSSGSSVSYDIIIMGTTA